MGSAGPNSLKIGCKTMEDPKSKNIWSEFRKIFGDYLKPSAKTANPDEALKEIEAMEAQTPIIKDALMRAVFRKIGLLKRDLDREFDSPQMSIDFFADMFVELYSGHKIKKSVFLPRIGDFISEAGGEVEDVYHLLKKKVAGAGGSIKSLQLKNAFLSILT